MRKLNLLAAVFLAAATSIVLPATAAEAACPVPADRDINVTRVVYQTGNELHVSDKVMLAGFEAGWVESHMNNLPCGDADSLGVFQQRPSQGWGTPAQIMDVHFASNSFFTRAINSERAHPGFTAGQIAQDVQRSAFPDRYDAARAKAQALLDEVKVVPPPARVRSVVTATGGQEFGIGPDGHVMSTFWSASIGDNGGWHAWFAIPTGYGDGVTAVNASVTVTTLNGQTQLFTTAADGRVISTFWSPTIPTNGGWHEWFAIPTGFYDGKTAPNAVITASGGQLFTTAPDGHVMSTFWSPDITDNGGWHAWFAIPTGFADGVTAANATVSMTTLNNQTQLFTTANDGHVISTYWSGIIPTNGGWHEWFAIPTGFYDGKTAPNAVITASGGQLFTTAPTAAPDGHVMSTFWSPSITTNGGWHEWFAIPTGFYDGKIRT
jgi:hypothetical protein